MSEFPSNKLQEIVARVVHKICWCVDAGGSGGNTFGLHIGDKLPWPIPLRDGAHRDKLGDFQGEFHVIVWCTWRLDAVDKPIASSDEDPDVIAAALQVLVGKTVCSMHVAPPAWDLSIGFSGGLNLEVFCDHIPGDPSFSGNWDLAIDDIILCAGPGHSLTSAKR